MAIKNITKNTLIAKKTGKCTSILSKTIGLMFSKYQPDYGLIFYFNKEKKILIHNFFVFYPIDIIYLDKNSKVIEIKENFKPFMFYSPKNKAKYLLETDAGSIRRSKTTINDTIGF